MSRLTPAQERLDASFREEDRRQAERDLREILSAPCGRRFLMAIIMQTGVYAHSRKTDDVAYLAARRDVGIEILQDANSSAPDLVMQARAERNKLISERNAQMKNLEPAKENK